ELAKEIKGSSPKEVGQKAQEKILKNIKKTVSEMGIEFDEWFSEQKELRDKGKVEEIIKWFKDKKLSYEKDGALWFKASEFGDIEDRVLVKENGEFTYFAVDCAYHKNKFEERKFDKVINVWGADHHGTVPRLEGFVEALGFKEKLEIILMQFVRLVKGGKSVKMSKREGNFVLVDDVLKEVGKDVFRYFMLTRSTNTHMDFDMELAKEQSKKNPVYYIQYAHARMQSILHKSQISNLKSQIIPNLEILNSKNERALILKLAKFPEIIEDISKDYQVHHLTTYAYELAKTFTDFYENESVLNAETKELKEIRLRLVGVTRQVLNDVLVLLGIEAPKKM
ncbi:MAG: arginine--tRNA ligase, partial [Candidatus Marinimicrobia bacterium]|nr:arginine--tRNA ligase [Candidatus Neomarinimicrobiota bacterium]